MSTKAIREALAILRRVPTTREEYDVLVAALAEVRAIENAAACLDVDGVDADDIAWGTITSICENLPDDEAIG